MARARGQRDHRSFLLQRVQPAMTGLIDGSLSTLAPIFAVAFATHKPHYAFLAGLATAIGAGRVWPSRGIIGPAPLSVSFQPLMDLECTVHVELPVHALLPGPEVRGCLRHWDYLRPVDLVGMPIGHNGRRAFGEDVLQPVGALAVREGDQEAVTVLDGDDGCLIRPARSPPNMADDRRVGSFLAG
jgi:hypothetical protein